MTIFIIVLVSSALPNLDDRIIRPQYKRAVSHLDKSPDLYHSVLVNAILVGANIFLNVLTIKNLLEV